MTKTGKRRIAVLVTLILLLTGGLFFVKSISWLGVRLYQGPRIMVHLHFTADGEPVETSRFDEYSSESFIAVKKKDEYTIIDRADRYDIFTYSLKLKTTDGETVPLIINVKHFNWWEIVRSGLTVNIDTKKGVYSANEFYTFSCEPQTHAAIYYWETVSEPEQHERYTDSIALYAGCKG